MTNSSKVAEVAGGVTETGRIQTQIRAGASVTEDRQRPRLLCVGRLAEETVRATGQWPALLRLMAAQMEKVFTVGNFKPPKPKKLKPAPFDLQAWIWEHRAMTETPVEAWKLSSSSTSTLMTGTYDEIAEVLGVTRQRIPQILDTAITKVKRALGSAGSKACR